MTRTVAERLAQMKVALPEPPPPAGAYVGFVRWGDLVFVSGQLPLRDGKLAEEAKGRLGEERNVEQAAQAARLCAINLLAQMSLACEGDLERIRQCIRLGGFVASTPQFSEHPQVVNGASDFMREALGEKGIHARAAVGVSALPLGACVEVEGAFAIR